MPDERRHQADRRIMPTRPERMGRRLFDQSHPDTATIVLNLKHWATLAEQQGQVKTKALCLIAAARLEELEALVAVAKARQITGGKARAEKLTPAQRSVIARQAAYARHEQDRPSK